MPSRDLVVGVGNALQGADGFGPAVVERLRSCSQLPPDATLLDAHTDLLNHLESFVSFDRVILVDAVVGGDGSDGIVVASDTSFSECNLAPSDAHSVSPSLAIALFRRLFPAASTSIVLVGFQTMRIAAGDVLREDQIDAGVTAVLRLLRGEP